MAAPEEVVKCCATCANAVPVQAVNGFNSREYRHCAIPAYGLPVNGWLIGANKGCGHTPSKWTA